jgi:hypothetical protein
MSQNSLPSFGLFPCMLSGVFAPSQLPCSAIHRSCLMLIASYFPFPDLVDGEGAASSRRGKDRPRKSYLCGKSNQCCQRYRNDVTNSHGKNDLMDGEEGVTLAREERTTYGLVSPGTPFSKRSIRCVAPSSSSKFFNGKTGRDRRQRRSMQETSRPGSSSPRTRGENDSRLQI